MAKARNRFMSTRKMKKRPSLAKRSKHDKLLLYVQREGRKTAALGRSFNEVSHYLYEGAARLAAETERLHGLRLGERVAQIDTMIAAVGRNLELMRKAFESLAGTGGTGSEMMGYDGLRGRGISLSPRQIHRKVLDGTFPKPVKLGDQTKAWVVAEIDEWIRARMDER